LAIQRAADAQLAGLPALVLRARAGDRSAFTLLYQDFAATVHGIVLSHAGVRDAEDVTQEVFVNAFQRLPELRDPAAFPAWLCAAARNAAIDRRRSFLRAPQLADLAAAEGRAAADRAPLDQAAGEEIRARVLAQVQSLPEAYRETLVLRLVEGLTGPEIAARTGLTHGSVRVNLTRGMAQLRRHLQEAGLS
jgi:RNA polymerase sigma-70 factor (ECF subfamily)